MKRLPPSPPAPPQPASGEWLRLELAMLDAVLGLPPPAAAPPPEPGAPEDEGRGPPGASGA